MAHARGALSSPDAVTMRPTDTMLVLEGEVFPCPHPHPSPSPNPNPNPNPIPNPNPNQERAERAGQRPEERAAEVGWLSPKAAEEGVTARPSAEAAGGPTSEEDEGSGRRTLTLH